MSLWTCEIHGVGGPNICCTEAKLFNPSPMTASPEGVKRYQVMSISTDYCVELVHVDDHEVWFKYKPEECDDSFVLASAYDLLAAENARLRAFKDAVMECKDETWQCPGCGHADDWWHESNADYATRDIVAALAEKP